MNVFNKKNVFNYIILNVIMHIYIYMGLQANYI